MISFPFVFFPLYACIHTYIYEFSCWILFKAHRLVNKHDTKDSNELEEDHNINYSVGFGVWAQFRDKFLIQIAQLLIPFVLDTGWRENLWAQIQCWSVGLYVLLISYFLFESFYLFIYLSTVNVLCMGFDFVSYFVCKKWHE